MSDRIMRITTGVSRLAHSPEIIEGQLSSTGKTVSVTLHPDSPGITESYRLNTEKLLDGETIFRDGRYFELYSKEGHRSQQRANHNPGPVAGANKVNDADELPEPTHS